MDHVADQSNSGADFQKNETMSKRLAIFDFDGTLVKQDSFELMIWHNHSIFKISHAVYLFIVPYFFSMGNQEKRGLLKEKIFSFFFKGYSAAQFETACKKITPYLLRGERVEILRQLKRCVEENYITAIVSASMPNWIAPWARQYQVAYIIGTTPAFEGDFLTGKFSSPNCNGPEKVRRIKNEILGLADFEEILAFGNSAGDSEMMKLRTK